MSTLHPKQRVLPKEPEWKIILKHIINQDEAMVYRVCRKMIIHLERNKISEVYFLMQELNPTSTVDSDTQAVGPNWPKPKGSPFVANDLLITVFNIADKYYSDDDITSLLTQWLNREKLGNLSKVLERRHAPLSEISEALKKYFRLGGSKDFTSVDERVGVRVSVIQRLFSESLRYVNIAKHYIRLDTLAQISERIIGPAYGTGKVGGKSAGLILAYQILKMKKKNNPLLKNIFTPQSWFLTSDGILEFIHYNALDEFSFIKYQPLDSIKIDYQFLEYIFKNSHFPPDTLQVFNKILDDITDRPIVVRSSSLLEDSFEATFSGKYKSLFISNVGTREERLNALTDAIAEVYASTFGPDPIAYRKSRGLLDFREEMGILIQEVVGNKIGKYFLPSYAGVAMSNNEFRWSNRLKREDGVIRLVAGLGTRAVDRTMQDYPTLISPGQPDLRTNLTVKDTLRYSQTFIDVINLETNSFETVSFSHLIKECKGVYPEIDKIVSFVNGMNLMDPISAFANFAQEDCVVTFNNLLKKTDFVSQIREMLRELSAAYETAVDIEFASDGDKLYLLQCRPQGRFTTQGAITIPPDVSDRDKIFSAEEFVNDGKFEDINFVVYVCPVEYGHLATEEEMRECAKIIGKLNNMLPKRKFILIGPGRWGSKGDIKLGVPIIYSDINNTAMLIEMAKSATDYVPELSFGTHFFQDLVEADIKYLPLYPDKKGNLFNEDFFYKTPNSLSMFLDGYQKYEKVVRLIDINYFEENGHLAIYMDAESGKALAFVKKNDVSGK